MNKERLAEILTEYKWKDIKLEDVITQITALSGSRSGDEFASLLDRLVEGHAGESFKSFERFLSVDVKRTLSKSQSYVNDLFRSQTDTAKLVKHHQDICVDKVYKIECSALEQGTVYIGRCVKASVDEDWVYYFLTTLYIEPTYDFDRINFMSFSERMYGSLWKVYEI